MKIGKYKPSQIRKAAVAAAGAVVLLANSLVNEFTTYLPTTWSAAVNVGVGFITAVSVFLVKNAPLIDAADDFDL